MLALRERVFTFEQQCSEPDMDGRDEQALHVMLFLGEELMACLRVLPSGLGHEAVSIGRVVAARRGEGLGRAVMAEGIRAARDWFGERHPVVGAQLQAAGFYEALGFRAVSESFVEAGIPHVLMRLEEKIK